MYNLRMHISNLIKTVGFVAFFDCTHFFLGPFEWVDNLHEPFTPHLIIVANPTILSNVGNFTISNQWSSKSPASSGFIK